MTPSPMASPFPFSGPGSHDAVEPPRVDFTCGATSPLVETIEASSRAALVGVELRLSLDDCESLAKRAPDVLLGWIANKRLPSHTLTFAVEHLGRAQPKNPAILPVLRSTLRHQKAHVREGTLYGLAARFPELEAVSLVRWASVHDRLPEIRAIASELLEVFG